MTDRNAKGGSRITAGIAGLVLVALAWIEARTFPLQDLQEGLGAAFFPYLVLGIIAVLGLALIIHGLVLGPRFALPFDRNAQLTGTAALFAVFVAFTLAFANFGLLVPAGLFLMFGMRILGASWTGAVVVGWAAAGAIHALFAIGFGVPMP